MKRQKRVATLSPFLLLAAAGSLLLIGGALVVSTTLAAQPPYAPPHIFRDDAGRALAIQLENGSMQIGAYTFRVPGVGDYTGATSVAVTGAQTFSVSGESQAKLYPQSGSPSLATVSLQGDIDTARGTVSLTVWIDGARSTFTVEDFSQSSVPDSIAQQVLNSLVTQDWTTVYGLLASDLQTSMTQTQFNQSMTDPSLPVVTSASLTGLPDIHTNPNGYPLYSRAVSVSARGVDGVMRSYTSTILLSRENGQWRFLGTDAPTAV